MFTLHQTLIMFLKLHFILSLFIAITLADEEVTNPLCEDFSEGVSFSDTQAFGTWLLLHFKTDKAKGTPGEPQCVQFTPVNTAEQKNLSERIGKLVNDVKWEKVVLNMQIPCTAAQSNGTQFYYLEKLKGPGSYRTLQMPSAKDKLEDAHFRRYPMRLKIIENKYMAMMDCTEHFVFLLGKESLKGKKLDEKLKKMIEQYWVEDY